MLPGSERQRVDATTVRILLCGLAGSGQAELLRLTADGFSQGARSNLFVAGRDGYALAAGQLRGRPLRCELVVAGDEHLSELAADADGLWLVVDGSPASLADTGLWLTNSGRTARGHESCPLWIVISRAERDDVASDENARAALGLPSAAVLRTSIAGRWGAREALVSTLRLIDGQRDRAPAAPPPQPPADLGSTPQPAAAGGGSQPILEPDAAPAATTSGPAEDAFAWPLPTPPLAPRACWPRSAAADLLAAVPWTAARVREDLVGRHGATEGSGTSDLILVEVAAWCAKSSLRRTFDSFAAARGAMLDLARRKRRLGALRPPSTALAVVTEAARWRLWTVCPWRPALRGQMASAAERGGEADLATLLAGYASAVVDAVRLAARHGVLLDVHPSNFADTPSGIVYLDDDIDRGCLLPAIGHAILHRVDEYAAFPAAVEAYVDALLAGFEQRLAASDLAATGLSQALGETTPRTAAGRMARGRIERTLWRLR
jgi:hypothetical protein